MASCGPAGALLQEVVASMVNTTDLQAVAEHFSKVALQAEIRIADLQHLAVYTAM